MSEQNPVLIREADDSDHDLEGMVRVANLARPEILVTVDFMRYLDSIIDPKIKQKRWVAEMDGKIVGYAMYTQDAAMYHPRKFRATAMVEPDYEKHGIGSALHETLLEDLKQHDPLELLLIVREDHERGVAFAKARGFVEFNRRWGSRLDLTTFDADPFLAKLKSVENSGIIIRSYADLKNDPQYSATLEKECYELHSSLTDDIPMPLTQVNDTMEQFRKDILNNPSFLPDLSLIALKGDQFLGLTEVIDLDNGNVLTWRTGTLRAYRREGIATTLKVRSIQIAKERGYQEMETFNDLVNEPILHVNDALGFVRDPAELWMVLKFD